MLSAHLPIQSNDHPIQTSAANVPQLKGVFNSKIILVFSSFPLCVFPNLSPMRHNINYSSSQKFCLHYCLPPSPSWLLPPKSLSWMKGGEFMQMCDCLYLPFLCHLLGAEFLSQAGSIFSLGGVCVRECECVCIVCVCLLCNLAVIWG